MIVFENPGHIEPVFLSTFGASVKSDGAIGYFGTGLKFAIATLLRNKQQITIICGDTEYAFSLKEKVLRGQPFQMVHMNDVSLGFTTDLGKDWKMWMAFRELYCNALDEKGTVYEHLDWQDFKTDPTKTYIVVEGELTATEFHTREQNFIGLDRKPVALSNNVEIYTGGSNYVYYKGIRVADAPNCKYTYNLLGKVELTEDRTAKNSPAGTIASATIKLKDKALISDIIKTVRGHYEHQIDYNCWYETPSNEFLEAALLQFRADQTQMASSIGNLVSKHHPDLLWVEAELTKVQQAMLAKAKLWAAEIGFDPSPYPVKIVETLGSEVLALADMKRREIIIAKPVFDKGTKVLCQALIEEAIHLIHNLHDETRSMQTFLFQKIMSMAEELKGEPI